MTITHLLDACERPWAIVLASRQQVEPDIQTMAGRQLLRRGWRRREKPESWLPPHARRLAYEGAARRCLGDGWSVQKIRAAGGVDLKTACLVELGANDNPLVVLREALERHLRGAPMVE